MDGGIDAVYVRHFGFDLETRVRAAIEQQARGELPVGQALVVETKKQPWAWLVVAPTMRVPDDVGHTVNAFLAMRAALLAVERHNASVVDAQRIGSVLCPGLCTAVGCMEPEVAARQMRRAWDNVVGGARVASHDDARRSQGALRGRAWAIGEETEEKKKS